MKNKREIIVTRIDKLIEKYPILVDNYCEIEKASNIMIDTYESKGKILVAGNGGSASDSEHIVGELMKRFVSERKISNEFKDKLVTIDHKYGERLSINLECGVPAISLSSNGALSSAICNDIGGDYLFAQQVFVLCEQSDLFLGISTSGNSVNIINAAIVAKAKGASVLALTGRDGGVLKDYSDVAIIVDKQETYEIQELHLPIYHCLCLIIEDYFFGKYKEENYMEKINEY